MRGVRNPVVVALSLILVGWTLASGSAQDSLAVPEGEVVVLDRVPTLTLTLVERSEPDTVKVGPDITLDEVVRAFEALKGGDKAIQLLTSLGVVTRTGTRAPTPLPQLKLEDAAILLTPLKPERAGHSIFTWAQLGLWNVDACGGYSSVPAVCDANKAYFLDSTDFGGPLHAGEGRINGRFKVTQPGWYIFVVKVQGMYTIRFTAYVNDALAGNFTVTGVGVMPILVNLPAGQHWVRFDQVGPWPSRGAFISLKAWKL